MDKFEIEDEKYIVGSPDYNPNSLNICNEQKNKCIVKIKPGNVLALDFYLKFLLEIKIN